MIRIDLYKININAKTIVHIDFGPALGQLQNIPGGIDVQTWSQILPQQILRLEYHQLGRIICCGNEAASEIGSDAEERLH